MNDYEYLDMQDHIEMNIEQHAGRYSEMLEAINPNLRTKKWKTVNGVIFILYELNCGCEGFENIHGDSAIYNHCAQHV